MEFYQNKGVWTIFKIPWAQRINIIDISKTDE